jgi:hypothetical protein
MEDSHLPRRMFGDNDTAMAAAAAEPITTQPAAVNAPIFLPGEADDGDCRRSSIARSFDFARSNASQIRNVGRRNEYDVIKLFCSRDRCWHLAQLYPLDLTLKLKCSS